MDEETQYQIEANHHSQVNLLETFRWRRPKGVLCDLFPFPLPFDEMKRHRDHSGCGSFIPSFVFIYQKTTGQRRDCGRKATDSFIFYSVFTSSVNHQSNAPG